MPTSKAASRADHDSKAPGVQHVPRGHLCPADIFDGSSPERHPRGGPQHREASVRLRLPDGGQLPHRARLPRGCQERRIQGALESAAQLRARLYSSRQGGADAELRHPYSILGMDLRTEPIVFTVPAIDKQRYFSIQLVDAYTFNFDYIGSRATGNGGGKYLVAGPGWKGETPKGVAKVIHAETELVLALYRTQLFNAADIDNVKKVQAGYKVQVTRRRGRSTAEKNPLRSPAGREARREPGSGRLIRERRHRAQSVSATPRGCTPLAHGETVRHCATSGRHSVLAAQCGCAPQSLWGRRMVMPYGRHSVLAAQRGCAPWSLWESRRWAVGTDVVRCSPRSAAALLRVLESMGRGRSFRAGARAGFPRRLPP